MSDTNSDDSSDSPIFTIRSSDFGLGFFDRMYATMMNRNFYRIPLIEPGLKAFFYLVKLFLIFGFLIGIFYSYSQWNLSHEVADDIKHQLPVIHYNSGDLDVDAELPHRIRIMDSYEIILDPEATLNRVKLDPKVLMVVVNGAVFVRENTKQFEAWSIRPSGSESVQTKITPATIDEWLPYLQGLIILLSLFFGIMQLAFQNTLRMVLISVGGLIASRANTTMLNWKSFIKISSYAITPIVIADTVISLLRFKFPYYELTLLIAGTLWVYWIFDSLINQRIQSSDSSDEHDEKNSSDNT